MSVTEFNKDLNVAIIDQKLFLKSVYGNIKEIEDLLESFEIKTPFRMDLEAEKMAKSIENKLETVSKKKKKKKRKLLLEDDIFQDEIIHLKEKIASSRHLLEKHFPGQATLSEIRENNRNTREKVRRLLETLREQTNIPDIGSNDRDDSHKKNGIFFPPRSSYIKMDISEMSKFQNTLGKFDLILLDPPWENKHIKRHKNEADGYTMLGNTDLLNIPVEKFLNDDGLVLVWATNSPSVRQTLDEMFLKWGLVKVTTWYWLKVTTHGELICDFSHSKQPYEICVVGQSKRRKEELSLEAGLVLVSVPSGINSHKPPLERLLAAVTRNKTDQMKKLEMFGRNLSPGWTTIGNQPFLLNVIPN